jgi:hypothetical protein
LPDPFAPDGCWDGDCFVARAFRWKNGEMADLGALAPGFSSDVSWMSPNGLISGEAQPGEVDPNGGWTMHGILWASVSIRMAVAEGNEKGSRSCQSDVRQDLSRHVLGV